MEKLLALGIDPWAILVYIVNTGLLLFILSKLLYKPVLKIIDQRREAINKSMSEAEKLRAAFQREITDLEKQKKKTEEELKDEIKKLHKFTEEKRTELIKEMDEAKNVMMQKAQVEIDDKKQRMIKEVEQDVKILMGKIILDIVENKVPENVIEESISSGWKRYNK